MKRVLMVSHCYPPMASPGALRSSKFARYLPEFGWSPVVLTPRGGYSRVMGGDPGELPGVRVVRTPFLGGIEKAAAGALRQPGGVRSAAVRALKAVVYPDRVGPWYPFAMAAGAKLMRGERFDALYSTSPSLINHVIAMHLSRMFGVPWVADFRDLFTQGPIYTGRGARARLDRRLERRILRYAGRVLSVSRHNVELFAEVLPEAAGKLHVVRNGYDPADLPAPAPPPPGPFVLTYAGSFYGARRNPRGLFQALAALRDAGEASPETFRMEIIGDPEEVVVGMAEELGVQGLVHHVGRLPYGQTLERLAASRALCVITFTDEGSQGEMTTKLFEYMGVGRPILALTVPGSELGDVVAGAGAGAVLHPSDTPAIAAWLRARMAEPAGAAAPDPAALYPFTRRAQAGELAGHLDAAGRG